MVHTRTKLHPDETPVQPGLAYTPKMMEQLTREGIPVSTHTVDASYFDDGSISPYLKMEYRRGIDKATLWEKSMDTKRRMNKIHRDVLKNNPVVSETQTE